MTRYRWVAARKAEGFPTTTCCETAGVSTSAFYAWVEREAAGPTAREQADEALVAVIRRVHVETDGTYGSPRMVTELADRGHQANHKRVERLMRVNGIVGVFKPAKVRTTLPAELYPPLPDLIERRFAPDGMALFDCRAVPITRYRYCGSKIATPWTTEIAAHPAA